MKKSKVKKVCILNIIILLFSCLAVANPVFGATRSWNMGDTVFKNLGIISSTQTVEDLTLLATEEKSMEIVPSSVTVGSSTYNYALALGGSGSINSRAMSVNLSNGSKHVIKVTSKSTGSATRTLNVVDENGNLIDSIPSYETAETNSITIYDYNGKIYIYSTDSGINIYKLQIDTTEDSSATNSITVKNFDDLANAAKTMASTDGGGTIYVDSKKVECTEQLLLSGKTGNQVSIVGVKQSDGTYPVLDFSKFRSASVGSTGSSLTMSTESMVGIKINGADYTIKNLIIQKAPDKGLIIKGENAKNNIVENCILRYNNNAGLHIGGGASNNTVKYCYSYRNCDVYSRGLSADGFAPKLGANTGNRFIGCYSWDNSDDGFDSFDKTTSGYTYDMYYEYCGTWNNGNPKVFTGEYDYELGKSLDTNLFLVELMMKNDSSFQNNYENRQFTLPSSSFINTDIGKLSVTNWIANYKGSPNGFKMGSEYSLNTLERTFVNCFATNHKNKGFDNNNSALIASLTNCVAFDNGFNYHMPNHTIVEWSNNKGFSGGSNDKLPGAYDAIVPSSNEQQNIRNTVKSTIAYIEESCNANKIPGKVIFDIY